MNLPYACAGTRKLSPRTVGPSCPAGQARDVRYASVATCSSTHSVSGRTRRQAARTSSSAAGRRQPVGGAHAAQRHHLLAAQQIQPRMVGVEPLGTGLQGWRLRGEARGFRARRRCVRAPPRSHARRRQPGSAPFGGGVGTEPATDDEPVTTELEVPACALLASRECGLVGLVRRLVGAETQVAVRSEELGRTELVLELEDEGAHRSRTSRCHCALWAAQNSRVLSSSRSW